MSLTLVIVVTVYIVTHYHVGLLYRIGLSLRKFPLAADINRCTLHADISWVFRVTIDESSTSSTSVSV